MTVLVYFCVNECPFRPVFCINSSNTPTCSTVTSVRSFSIKRKFSFIRTFVHFSCSILLLLFNIIILHKLFVFPYYGVDGKWREGSWAMINFDGEAFVKITFVRIPDCLYMSNSIENKFQFFPSTSFPSFFSSIEDVSIEFIYIAWHCDLTEVSSIDSYLLPWHRCMLKKSLKNINQIT